MRDVVTELHHTVGLRQYSVSDHLGNVLATVLDRKSGHGSGPYYDYWLADVSSATDYYPFGMPMQERVASPERYRLGYNGQLEDNEIAGNGNHVDFKFRGYDSRLGRFWSVDPLSGSYPWNSNHAFAENRVVDGVDLEGCEYTPATTGQYARDNTAVVLTPSPANVAIARDPRNGINYNSSPAIQQNWSATVWGSKAGYEYSKQMVRIEANLVPGGSIGIKALEGETITKKDVLWEAAFFLPIGRLGKIVGPAGEFLLKGANVFEGSACMDFSKAFMKRVAPTMQKEGAVVKRFEINIGNNGLIGTPERGLSNTGKHQFVEVTKEGKTVIFDNLHPAGIQKADYMEKLAGYRQVGGQGTHYTGEQLFNDAKSIQ